MQTFTKSERLCSKVLIERLVEKGKAFHIYPIKTIWFEIQNSDAPVKIVISVPKRNFKKAVERNKLKRQIREIYRKEKQNLYNAIGTKKIILMFIYTGKTKVEFKELENKIKQITQHLIENINELKK